MNLTLSAEEHIIEQARAWAAEHGTSINALVKEYLASLGSNRSLEEAATDFAENARNHAGRSKPDTRFSRDEIYTGKRFGEGAE